MAGHAGAKIDVLANAAEASGLVEVGGADALADHVPLGAQVRYEIFFRRHDIERTSRALRRPFGCTEWS